MDKQNLYYNYRKYKYTIWKVLIFILFIIIGFVGFMIYMDNNKYEDFESEASKRYKLAENIIGADSDGKITLYSTRDEEVVDSIDLKGDFIFDESDNFTALHALDIETGELFTLKVKENKITSSKMETGLKSYQCIDFDYDDENIVFLNKDLKSFSIKLKESDEIKILEPEVDEEINEFKVVKNDLLFTSGGYIFAKNLKSDYEVLSDIRVSANWLNIRDYEGVEGNIIGSIPMGEEVELLGQSKTGWYKVKYKETIGFVSNNYINFEKPTTDTGGLLKIYIGDKTLSIHEFKQELFLHNNFGSERNNSILLDINANDLYINDMSVFKEVDVSVLNTNIEDDRLYYVEVLGTKKNKTRQFVKFKKLDENTDNLGFKYTSDVTLDSSNSYGSLGFIYYRNKKDVTVFSLKSKESAFKLKVDEEKYMPIYSS